MSLDLVALLAFAVLAYGLVSRRLERGVVTPPMAFVALGLALGPAGLDLFAVEIDQPVIHALAEVTLVVLLFTDASRIDLRVLARQQTLPERMLALGLPLTILAGTGVGVAVLGGIDPWHAALIAAVLAPTDAALAQAVLANREVPVRLRQIINVESGLNDGLALPAVLVVMAVAGAATAQGVDGGDPTGWFRLLALQITLGPAIGVGVGWVGGRLLERSWQRGWVSGPFLRLGGLAIALLAFAGAELAGGNGFIAAFLGGLTFGTCARAVCPSVHTFGETEGQLLALLVFAVFGAAMASVALDRFDWSLLLYAVLSLTVVRMVPIAISLLGSGLRTDSVLFLGWFGPRGIASILFAALVVEEADLLDRSALAAIYLTILLSVFAHGISANPLAALYARRIGAIAERLRAAESRMVEELPLRVGGRRGHPDRR